MQSGRDCESGRVSKAQSVVSYVTEEMASKDVVTLPALQPKVRYQGVPRRYEETKPMFVRDLTHRSIVSKYCNTEAYGHSTCSIVIQYIPRTLYTSLV